MASKKVRRGRKARPETSKPTTTTPPTKTATAAPETAEPARPTSTAEQFQSEYAYVLKDLRLVFILAAIMFALLIVLNIVLQ